MNNTTNTTTFIVFTIIYVLIVLKYLINRELQQCKQQYNCSANSTNLKANRFYSLACLYCKVHRQCIFIWGVCTFQNIENQTVNHQKCKSTRKNAFLNFWCPFLLTIR